MYCWHRVFHARVNTTRYALVFLCATRYHGIESTPVVDTRSYPLNDIASLSLSYVKSWSHYEFTFVADTKKAKKARNAEKAAGKVLREEGLGMRIPGGSAESESGPYNQVIVRRITCQGIVSMSIYGVGGARSSSGPLED